MGQKEPGWTCGLHESVAKGAEVKQKDARPQTARRGAKKRPENTLGSQDEPGGAFAGKASQFAPRYVSVRRLGVDPGRGLEERDVWPAGSFCLSVNVWKASFLPMDTTPYLIVVRLSIGVTS